MRAIKRWEDPKWSNRSGFPNLVMVNPPIVRLYRASLEGMRVRKEPDRHAPGNVDLQHLTPEFSQAKRVHGISPVSAKSFNS